MAKKIKDVLPKKPSALIRLALSDLEKVQRMKTRKVNMSVWGTRVKGVCTVCLAGSVMDRTLKISSSFIKADDRDDAGFGYHPNSQKIRSVMGERDIAAVLALNNMRQGEVSQAATLLGITKNVTCLDRDMPAFVGKGVKFKRAMKELAKDLEKAGL